MARPLSCGRCRFCRLEYSRQWAVRCLHEAKLYDSNLFATFTYAEDRWSLVPSHFPLFMKRLRKYFGERLVRFYMGGEYGELNFRPHYHAILFNVEFSDVKYFRTTDAGFKIYTSARLDSLWGHGFVNFGEVTFESASYVARYCLKKCDGAMEYMYECIDPETGEVYRKEKEFGRMSLRPGIGEPFFQKFRSDMYPHGLCVVNGKEVRPPKFYDRLFKRSSPDAGFALAQARHLGMLDGLPEQAPDRLTAREIVSSAALSQKRRS